jgi:hypothetical protein
VAFSLLMPILYWGLCIVWMWGVAGVRSKRKINITRRNIKECIKQRYNIQHAIIMW